MNSKLPRFKEETREVKTITPPWAESYERHTKLFEMAAISLLEATKNQTQTAKLLRCKFDLINRIMHKAAKRGIERRKAEDEKIRVLSIDEKSFQRGHQYVTILSDSETGRVLEVCEHRTLESRVNN
ncbi:MAG: helix-turn-helix domain-containing protein [Pyrinomonadaceae bacterium]